MDILLRGTNGRAGEIFVNLNLMAYAMFDGTPGYEKLQLVTAAGATVTQEGRQAAEVGHQLQQLAHVPTEAPRQSVTL